MLLSEAFNRVIIELRLNGGAEKTARNYITARNSITGVCGDIPIELLTYEHVVRWRLSLSQYKQSSTISSYLTKVREVLKFYRKHGVNVLDPRDIELPKVIINERDFVTPHEAIAMVDYAERPRDKALIALLWSSGARIAEILNVNRESIINGKVHVIGKNSKQVTIRVDSMAQKYIAEYIETRSDRLPALFISSQMRRMTVQRAEQIVNQVAGELGFTRPDGTDKNITPHTFRHGYATDLLMNGADLVTTSKLMGHSSINTTRIYTHVTAKVEDEHYARFHSV